VNLQQIDIAVGGRASRHVGHSLGIAIGNFTRRAGHLPPSPGQDLTIFNHTNVRDNVASDATASEALRRL